MLAMLFSLRGSVCLYQGEELGLPEADVPFERIHAPLNKLMVAPMGAESRLQGVCAPLPARTSFMCGLSAGGRRARA